MVVDMKAKLIVPVLFVGLLAVACSEGVDAGDPSLTDLNGQETTERTIATSAPATVTRLTNSNPTATPVPAPDRISPTAIVSATTSPRPVVGAPSPVPTQRPQATATRAPFNPNATPTPLWAATPRPAQTATPTPQPTTPAVVLPTVNASPDDLFRSRLNYQYTLPSGWLQQRTESALVLYDASAKVSVTISEKPIERWRYQTVAAMGAATFPDRPNGWTVWSSQTVGLIKNGDAYEFQFTGTKNGQSYLQIVHWYFWGDVHVEVSLQVPRFDWDVNSNVRNQVQVVLDSFSPHDRTNLLTAQEVWDIMYERMDNRPSGVFARNEQARLRYELTCREIYEDLMQQPQYADGGVWQVVATTPFDGLQSWWVFEPSGTIMSLASNASGC